MVEYESKKKIFPAAEKYIKNTESEHHKNTSLKQVISFNMKQHKVQRQKGELLNLQRV